jgi:dihydroflavonol-4-reductase
MRVLVTGGSGFIGSVVARTLTASGHEVRCLLRATSKTDRLAGLAYERVEGDVRDADAVREALAGCDAVIHLASLSNWSDMDSPLMSEVVVGGTRNLLEAARAMEPRPRVVFVSSAMAVNGSDRPSTFDESAPWSVPDAKLSYCRAKRAAEAVCLEAHGEGVPVVIVNPGEVYGPNDNELITAGNLVDWAKSKPVLVCAGGTAVAHVDDVALAIVRALEKGRSGERYILGGDNLSVRQLAELCLDLLGQKKSIVQIPNTLLRGITRVATALRVPLPYNPHVVPYATKYWFMDSSKARRELGVEFRSARDTLAPTLEWLKESGRIQA